MLVLRNVVVLRNVSLLCATNEILANAHMPTLLIDINTLRNQLVNLLESNVSSLISVSSTEQVLLSTAE